MNLSKIPSSLNGLLLVMGVMAPLLMIGAVANPALIGLYTTIYVGVSALAGLGMFFFDRSKKAKADGFAKSVESNAASAEGVKDPHKIAQLDHLRKEFQRGIDIYRQYGKDLYSLPWYVVVGESESGKTEMLRRSEIGFPDKLQDRWQGAGGTLSMHWWFTNRAVILDTAGRLFVDEGEAAASRAQWTNFLQMLKKNRPDCPINGLLLVIPSNRLLTHPNSEIEAARLAELDKNAGQIATQMETLQSELGVRFPVYILITKMDKLSGFREFFARIESPEERYQMLGWSNPAALGSDFDPQSVADYMASVADRLNRRMMSELRQVTPEDPHGLRIDEVDSLFAFPTVFESMSGKLTRYLRHIFTADEWSSKPPFLRGIYFTSALQQGAVLDEAIAAALGVPFERMDSAREDDGLSLSRNRTYFVRDLFLDKIFREKGLVTSAGKIKQAVSGWKLWAPALALGVILLFGVIGLVTLRKNDEARVWRALWASDVGKSEHRIPPLATFRDGKMQAARPEDAATVLAALDKLGPMVRKPPYFGWAFVPAQTFDKRLTQGRREVYADLTAESLAKLEGAVIGGLMAKAGGGADAAEKPAELSAGEWSALHALVILRHATTWDAKAGKLAFAGNQDQPPSFQLEALISELMAFAGVRAIPGREAPPARLLAQALCHAADLPRNLLQDSLRNQRASAGASERDILGAILPVDSLRDERRRAAELNRLADDLLDFKADSYSERSVRELASRVSELRPPDDEGEPARHGGAQLATNRAALLGFILSHREIMGYGALEAGEALKDPALALLANDGALLDEVKRTFTLVHPDANERLDLTAIQALAKPPATAAKAAPDGGPEAEARAEAAERIRDKLAGLRKAWFKDRFFPRQFHRYLRKPVARDAPPGTADELLMLWKLCELADDWKVDTDRARRLIAVFDFFFDTKAIKDNEIPLRECEILIKSTGVATHAVLAGTRELGRFNLMEAGHQPVKFKLDQALAFTKDGKADGSTRSWELVDRIDIGGQYVWRWTSGSGAAYDITVAGRDPKVALKDWPTLADFQPRE